MYLLLLTALASLQACFTNGDDVLQKLRPDGFKEECDAFWNTYGRKDLEKSLRKQPNMGKAKNIIFFLGDGMGVNSVTAGRIYKGQKAGKSGEEEEMAWDLFPYTGLSKTYTVDSQVTDSSSTATAMFTGVKTNFGTMGIDSMPVPRKCDVEKINDRSLPTIMDWFQKDGRDTGIISDDRITGGSPAALFAKTTNRLWEADTNIPDEHKACKDIAKQLIDNNAGKKANVIFGGGLKNFLLKKDGGLREDEDLVKKYKKEKEGQEFATLFNNKDLREWNQSSEFTLGLFSMSTMPYHVDRNTSNTGTPSLSEMVTAAINRLSQNKKGFFLMVEAAMIDQAHHANDAHRALDETMEMELAVRAAIENNNINIDETLIIVTADHSHSFSVNGYPARGNPILGNVYHEAGLYSRYPDGTKRPYSTISYANGPGYFKHHTNNPDLPWKDPRDMDYNSLDYIHPAMTPGPWNTETHSGEDVAMFGIGPMSHLLSGVHEQSYLGHMMAYAACVGNYEDVCGQKDKARSELNWRRSL